MAKRQEPNRSIVVDLPESLVMRLINSARKEGIPSRKWISDLVSRLVEAECEP